MRHWMRGGIWHRESEDGEGPGHAGLEAQPTEGCSYVQATVLLSHPMPTLLPSLLAAVGFHVLLQAHCPGQTECQARGSLSFKGQ